MSNNATIAHQWAHQIKTSGTGSHFFYEGPTIYSYGHHFPIARLFKGVVLFTIHGYSSSTARHCSEARGAVSHLQKFQVDDVTKDPSGKDVKNYAKWIKQAIDTEAKRRKPDTQRIERLVSEANLFCETFGFKTRFEVPANLDELKEKAAAQAKKTKERDERNKRQAIAAAKVTLAQWLNGDSVSFPAVVQEIHIRIIERAGEKVAETSKGVRFSLEDAQRAFRFVRAVRNRGEDWHTNGETLKVGDYNVEKVSAAGDVKAGCHFIKWEQIEEFATRAGF